MAGAGATTRIVYANHSRQCRGTTLNSEGFDGMTREELEKVRAWADAKIATGGEPPWAWYQYMKLRETIDAILAGQAATRTVDSPQLEPHQETGLRLVASNGPQDIARSRQSGTPVQLPM
jgi:hypothetical protein